MRKKLAGYALLSLSSFFFFFVVFHTTANAEGSPGIFAPLLVQASPPPLPTHVPTLTPVLPTNSPTPTELPSPTPTNTPTPTPTIQPTETPTPTPTETPTPTPTEEQTFAPSDLESFFSKYADEYHIDKELLKKIADCESHFNPNANNNDMYLGMYQFGEGAWIGARSRMGLDTNLTLRTNAEESIRTAAYKISQGEQSAWPNCQ